MTILIIIGDHHSSVQVSNIQSDVPILTLCSHCLPRLAKPVNILDGCLLLCIDIYKITRKYHQALMNSAAEVF